MKPAIRSHRATPFALSHREFILLFYSTPQLPTTQAATADSPFRGEQRPIAVRHGTVASVPPLPSRTRIPYVRLGSSQNRPAPPPTPATRGASSGRTFTDGHEPLVTPSSAITRPSACRPAYAVPTAGRDRPLAAALAPHGGQVAARKHRAGLIEAQAPSAGRSTRSSKRLAWSARSGRRGYATNAVLAPPTPKRVAEVACQRGCRFPRSRSPSTHR